MERERKNHEQEMSRAENPVVVNDVSYRGLQNEIASLRSELQAERERTRDFHNTYIQSLFEVANDIKSLDKNGSCKFCNTFKDEYIKMQSRSETTVNYESDEASEVDVDMNDDSSDYF